MKKEQIKYEEWLTTIANTRLVYNTMAELEEFLDNRSIHSNGMKRSFGSYQKLRSTFRDLKVEVGLQTDNLVNLDDVLIQYKKAWRFFHANLYRRAKPENIALELMTYCCSPNVTTDIGAKKAAIYAQIVEQDISIPFLVLMLMKVIPGYDSKEGDVNDISRQYENIMQLMEKFINDDLFFSKLPLITRAREERHKTRLKLLFSVQQILDTYMSYMNADLLYDLADRMKEDSVDLDIVGYWNECGGGFLNTSFWHIEKALNAGTYFMTHWHKDSENKLTGITYTLLIIKDSSGNLIYYMLHPEAIKHRMKGLQYGDADNVWYHTDMLDYIPEQLPLLRLMHSGVWPSKILLTRCTEKDVVTTYDKWLHHDCQIVKPFQHLEYDFRPCLYAVTPTHLYITSEKAGEYYKVPKSSFEGFDRIQLSDNVGLMTMNGKIYLVFDEFMLYIHTNRNELKKHKIERVNSID